MATASQSVELKPINRAVIEIKISGLSPLIQHKWSDKALIQMREKHSGKRTKNREIRNKEQEMADATYFKKVVNEETGETEFRYAIPVEALKASIIGAAHKDLGIEKTLVRKAFFIRSDVDRLLPLVCSPPILREDAVRVGQGSTDLRYRPEFTKWECTFDVEFDAELLQVKDIVNLVNRAGFGVGIQEWRPEKGGDFGRFEVVGTA